MRDANKKKESDARRHRERMANDLEYRMRKLFNCIRARCFSGKGRDDWEWYGAKGLEVTITVDDLKALWWRDRADTMNHPTIDRKQSAIGYVLENCRFIERADNLRAMIPTRRKRRWHKKPVQLQTLAERGAR